jgi:flagellar biosynthesis protein FlhA
MLLGERVSIRPLGAILETLGQHALRTHDPVLLAEHVRARLARTLSAAWRDAEHRLRVVTLDPAIEDRIRAGLEHDEHGPRLRMPPRAVEEICEAIAEEIEQLTAGGYPPVLLVDPRVRPAVRRMTASRMPRLVVLSDNEITRDTAIEAVGCVKPNGGERRGPGDGGLIAAGASLRAATENATSKVERPWK